MPIARLFAILVFLCCASHARADALDDALAKFLDNKFARTEQAVGELAASGAANATAILEALGDDRLMIDPVGHVLVYRTIAGDVVNAKTSEKLAGVDVASFKKVRINNALRSAIEAALGALTLANPDPQERIAAAEAVFKSRDVKALPALEAQLAKETDASAAAALRQARAAILALDSSAPAADRLAAIAALAERGDQDAQGLLDQVAAKTDDAALKNAAQAGLASIKTRLALWNVAQNLWYGVSASSVLLLAAIGLAITFGVMGVINMAHGEMVMLGAYTTFVVQSLLPPSAAQWSLAIALPLAFLVAGAVGIAIERLVIRFLYGRPLETLLATWGVSLILQQARAHDLRRQQPSGQRPGLHVRVDRVGRPVDHDRAHVDHRARRCRVRRAATGVARDAVRPADARRHQNRRMAAAMGVSTGRIDMFAFGLGSGDRRRRWRRAVADRQRLAQSRPGLHHRQLHGRGARRRRQSLGHGCSAR